MNTPIQQLDTFQWHWLLQDRRIPQLERLIAQGITRFRVARLGTYVILNTQPREGSVATYRSTRGVAYYIIREK